MQACLTVGLLLWAAMGAQGPSRAVRLDAGRLAVRAGALRHSALRAAPTQAQRELRAGLGAWHSLLPHALLLGLHSAPAPGLAAPPSAGRAAPRPAPSAGPCGVAPCGPVPARAP
jgi:hypothetical protein